MKRHQFHPPLASHSLQRTAGVALLAVVAIVAAVAAVSAPTTAITVTVTVVAVQTFQRARSLANAAIRDSDAAHSHSATL